MANYSPDKPDLVQRLRNHLFQSEGKKNIPLTDAEKEVCEKVSHTFTIWLQNPTYSDKMMLNYLKSHFDFSESSARRLLVITKQLLGNVQVSERKWHQHVFNETILEVINRAKENSDDEMLLKALDKYGRYNKLDKDTMDDIPWDKIIPPVTDFTSDPSVAGFKPIENFDKVRHDLMKKYGVEDAEYTEVTDGD